jgi:hypothetical protein
MGRHDWYECPTGSEVDYTGHLCRHHLRRRSSQGVTRAVMAAVTPRMSLTPPVIAARYAAERRHGSRHRGGYAAHGRGARRHRGRYAARGRDADRQNEPYAAQRRHANCHRAYAARGRLANRHSGRTPRKGVTPTVTAGVRRSWASRQLSQRALRRAKALRQPSQRAYAARGHLANCHSGPCAAQRRQANPSQRAYAARGHLANRHSGRYGAHRRHTTRHVGHLVGKAPAAGHAGRHFGRADREPRHVGRSLGCRDVCSAIQPRPAASDMPTG